jgi:hypothetical protein
VFVVFAIRPTSSWGLDNRERQTAETQCCQCRPDQISQAEERGLPTVLAADLMLEERLLAATAS